MSHEFNVIAGRWVARVRTLVAVSRDFLSIGGIVFCVLSRDRRRGRGCSRLSRILSWSVLDASRMTGYVRDARAELVRSTTGSRGPAGQARASSRGKVRLDLTAGRLKVRLERPEVNRSGSSEPDWL